MLHGIIENNQIQTDNTTKINMPFTDIHMI